MNIVMCGDSRAYCGIELVIYSTLTHNKNINWYIFSMDICFSTPNGELIFKGLDPIHKNKLRKIVAYLDPGSKITFINAAPYYEKYLSGSINEMSEFTPYAALRLIMDKALPYVNECLYFDADIAVCENLEDMYYKYKADNQYEAYATYAEDAFEGEGEMVSGIMFFNMAKCRETNFFERARKNYMINEYEFPDQMAMRDTSEIGQIPSRYGSMEDPLLTIAKPAIIHFTNNLMKIYSAPSPLYFYRKYPQFQYILTGLRLIDTIDLNIPINLDE